MHAIAEGNPEQAGRSRRTPTELLDIIERDREVAEAVAVGAQHSPLPHAADDRRHGRRQGRAGPKERGRDGKHVAFGAAAAPHFAADGRCHTLDDRIESAQRSVVNVQIELARLHLSLHLCGAFCTIWCVTCVL